MNVIRPEHMRAMKDQAILCNIGHFDCEIDVAWLEKNPEIKEVNIKPQVDQFVFPDGKRLTLLARGRLVNLGCANGHPSFVMSLVVLEPGARADRALDRDHGKYSQQACTSCPKKLDEKVAALHLGKLGVELTKLIEGAGGVPRRRSVEGSVQARALPLLRSAPGRRVHDGRVTRSGARLQSR